MTPGLDALRALLGEGPRSLLVEHNGEPWVALKPLFGRLGLDWKNHYRRVTGRFECDRVKVTAADGHRYDTLCTPLGECLLWLATIDKGDVSPQHVPMLYSLRDEARGQLTLWARP